MSRPSTQIGRVPQHIFSLHTRLLCALAVVAVLNIGLASAGPLSFLDDLGGGGGCVACTFTPANKLTNPTADLLKVAQPTTVNAVLEDAAMLLGGSVVRGNGLNDYLMMVMDKFTLMGGPISAVFVGHGNAGILQLGDEFLDATTKADFVAGAKGKINMLTLFGCCVASGTGPDFLQMLANNLMAPVMAYGGKIGVAKGDVDVMDGFYVEGGNATKMTFHPIPEPMSLLLLGTGLAMLLVLRYRKGALEEMRRASGSN